MDKIGMSDRFPGLLIPDRTQDLVTCGSGCKYFTTFPNKATGCTRYPPTVTIMMMPVEAALVRPGQAQFVPRELAAYPPVVKESPACGEFKVGNVS